MVAGIDLKVAILFSVALCVSLVTSGGQRMNNISGSLSCDLALEPSVQDKTCMCVVKYLKGLFLCKALVFVLGLSCTPHSSTPFLQHSHFRNIPLLWIPLETRSVGSLCGGSSYRDLVSPLSSEFRLLGQAGVEEVRGKFWTVYCWQKFLFAAVMHCVK